MKGFGTVVTGTLISGAYTKMRSSRFIPAASVLRVRGVQVHGAAAERAIAGQRTALNLAGVETADLARGMMLTPPQTFRPTTRVSVMLDLLPSNPGSPTTAGFAAVGVKDRARVHFHVFTAETIAEVRSAGREAVTARRIGIGRAEA